MQGVLRDHWVEREDGKGFTVDRHAIRVYVYIAQLIGVCFFLQKWWTCV